MRNCILAGIGFERGRAIQLCLTWANEQIRKRRWDFKPFAVLLHIEQLGALEFSAQCKYGFVYKSWKRFILIAT
jgi:hypothetical protein